jgi:hypothetical protein
MQVFGFYLSIFVAVLLGIWDYGVIVNYNNADTIVYW